jgi:hypothetical protein
MTPGPEQDSRMALRALPELAAGLKSSNNILAGFIGHIHLFIESLPTLYPERL